jgi:hypothetical protein
MVLENKSYGVGELRLWCWRVTIMWLKSDGCGVGEDSVTVMVSAKTV